MKNLHQDNIEKLDLDYAEAAELFSSDTLNAMQMAKVTGGTVINPATVKKVIEVIVTVVTIVTSIVTVVEKLTDDDSTPEDSSGKAKITMEDSNGNKKVVEGDSVSVVTKDGDTYTAVNK